MLRGRPAVDELYRLADLKEDQDLTDRIAELAAGSTLTCHFDDELACDAGYWHAGSCTDGDPSTAPTV